MVKQFASVVPEVLFGSVSACALLAPQMGQGRLVCASTGAPALMPPHKNIRCVYRHEYIDRCIGMCIDMQIDMCIDICTDMCIDMCIDMCTGMCMDMCIDKCVDMHYRRGSRGPTAPGTQRRVTSLIHKCYAVHIVNPQILPRQHRQSTNITLSVSLIHNYYAVSIVNPELLRRPHR